jgi:hypothetical protein
LWQWGFVPTIVIVMGIYMQTFTERTATLSRATSISGSPGDRRVEGFLLAFLRVVHAGMHTLNDWLPLERREHR